MIGRALVIALSLGAVFQRAPAPRASVRVVVAQVIARAEPRPTSVALGMIRYGAVLPLVASYGGWDHVIAFLSGVRIDVYVPAASLLPADTTSGDATMVAMPPTTVEHAASDRRVSVAVDATGKTVWLTASPTRSVPLVQTSATLDETAASRAMVDAIAGATPLPSNPAAPVTWTWLVRRSTVPVIGSAQPTLTAIYTDLAAGHFVPLLIRLAPAGPDWWLATMAQGRADAPVRSEADWTFDSGLDENVVRSAVLQAGAAGIMKIRFSQPLGSGDYAVVLRPGAPRSFAGLHVFAGPEFDADEAVVFGSVWPFHIA
jgi:hypothetical protein